MKSRMTALRMLAAAVTLSLAACAPPEDDTAADPEQASNEGQGTEEAPEDYLSTLVTEAEAEGELNVIALPPDWANYGAIIDAFQAKYDIKINSALPDTDSQTEINTAKKLAGTDRAPDVFDVSQSVALANTDMFAEYTVQTWDDIPDDLKDENGLWVNDYGGYMSIGYDSEKVPDVTKVEDLLGPDFEGAVALNGDPTAAGAAFIGVTMVSIANGGSPDDIAPGVEFFKKLDEAGNFLPVDPSAATTESGQTPVVIDWDYLNAAQVKTLPSWKVVVPNEAVVGGYYFQAINKEAPHPAAARLWQEFLYSDEGQNLWLQGGARPVRQDAMVEAGTIDEEAFQALPPVEGDPIFITDKQTVKAGAYLKDHWGEVTG